MEKERERVELNVRRPHSLILPLGRHRRRRDERVAVVDDVSLPFSPLSLSLSLRPFLPLSLVQVCDGAILIPRCGFMNKISGLSDGGVYRVAHGVQRARGARGGMAAVPRDHAKWRCPW